MEKKKDIVIGKTYGHWTVLTEIPEKRRRQYQWRCKCTLCGTEKNKTRQVLLKCTAANHCQCFPPSDLTGRQVGEWTVLSACPHVENTPQYWNCQCSCGTERAIPRQKLVEGRTRSCGCRGRNKYIGKQYGYRTVLHALPANKDGRVQFQCRCVCGVEKPVTLYQLTHQRSQSCGCKHKHNLYGQRFGRLCVVGKKPQMRIEGKHAQHIRYWECLCDCGERVTIKGASLLAGTTRSCGCYKQDIQKISGPRARNYKGERVQQRNGYIMVPAPGHPFAPKGRILEHRLLMEQVLGRYLTLDETVHHRNGVRWDNRLSNLEVWSKQHPPGQRATDLLSFAKEIIKLYSNLPKRRRKII